MSSVIRGSRSINLALQGGGSHGAYTWGVLDRLLQEDRLIIEGISGASAGAVNAIALAQGYTDSGREGARKALTELWDKISDLHSFSPVQRTPLDALLGNWNMTLSPAYAAVNAINSFASPYQTNPLNINPLQLLVEDLIDFKTVRKCTSIKLFVSATCVRSGRARIFERKEMSSAVIAASTCLPTLYQAVRIGKEYYWDGGYMGNPALWPLIYRCDSRDIMVVQISPVTRNQIPQTATDIRNRIDEITFNGPLMREMRAIAFVSRLLKEGSLDKSRYKDMLIHRIHSEKKLDAFDASSKMNAEWEFLQKLHKIGHNAADNWLKANWGKLGKKSSVNIEAEYL